jgi:hypothetical protein
MGRTVAYYNIFGTSKAKTDKAILVVNETGTEQTWMPLSVAQVKFIGKDYQVKVTVPDWFFRKISWKPVEEYVPKAKSTNPYIGQDVGNLMEEMMVLQEMNPPDVAKKLQLMQEAIDMAMETV